MSQTSLGKSKMQDVAEASGLIKGIIPREDMNKGEWLNATYQHLRAMDRQNPRLSDKERARWSYNRTYTIWHRTCRMIHAWEMDALRYAKAIRERREQDAARKLTLAKAEYRALTEDKTSRLAAAYSSSDPDFHRPQIDALAAIAARWIAPEIADD